MSIEMHEIFTSGHAPVATLQRLVDTLQLRKLFSIHPEPYEQFGVKVELLNNGYLSAAMGLPPCAVASQGERAEGGKHRQQYNVRAGCGQWHSLGHKDKVAFGDGGGADVGGHGE